MPTLTYSNTSTNIRGSFMKRNRKINKWLLAYRIAAGLIFLGTALYSLSFRMRGYDHTADTILETLFFVYAFVYIARTFYIVNK